MSAGDDTFDMKKLADELGQDEGKRNKGYIDSRGYMTVGIGRNLVTNGLSDAEVLYLFENDIQHSIDTLDANIPWWRGLAPNRQRVMINLCFNMGWRVLSQFHNFLEDMQKAATMDAAGDSAANMQAILDAAAHELQDSKWWGEVGLRGPRMVARLTSPAEPEPGTMPAQPPMPAPAPASASDKVVQDGNADYRLTAPNQKDIAMGIMQLLLALVAEAPGAISTVEQVAQAFHDSHGVSDTTAAAAKGLQALAGELEKVAGVPQPQTGQSPAA